VKRRKTNERAEKQQSHRFDKTSPKAQSVKFFHVSLPSGIVKALGIHCTGKIER
jgi:hypothetical protein